MALRFAETMAGTLDDAGGRPLAVSFTVAAAGEGRGYLRLTGTLRVGESSTPCHGVLVLRPGSLRYRVRGRDGTEVAGQKTVSLRRPLASLTTLPVTLADPHGEVLARGDLRFALRELPAFLLSFVRR